MSVFSKIFGTYSTRELKRVTPLVEDIERFSSSHKGIKYHSGYCSDFEIIRANLSNMVTINTPRIVVTI